MSVLLSNLHRLSADVVRVDLYREADVITSRVLEELLREALDSGFRHVLLDLSEVTFLDSSTLGVIIGAAKRLQERGGSVCLIAPSEAVLKVLQITRVDRVLNICEREQEALEKVTATPIWGG